MGLISGILALYAVMLLSIIVIELLWRIKIIAALGRKKAYTFAALYIGALAVIMFAPTVINDALSSTSTTYKTAPDLGNQEWLGFWGSYMGGVVGAVVTVAVFFFTYKQNQKQYEETRKQIDTQHRLQILPILSMTLSGREASSHNTQYQYLYLSKLLPRMPPDTAFSVMEYQVKNISQCVALFFTLRNGEKECAINHLLPGTETKMYLAVPWADKEYKGCFHLCFFDTEGNEYEQQVNFKCKGIRYNPAKLYLQQPSFPRLISNPSYKTDPSTRQPSEVNP